MVFDEVHSDLESAGYEVQAVVIPAAAVNAPHGRDRVWFVAFNTKSSRSTEVGGICEGSDNESIGICAKNGIATNTQFKSEGSDRGTNDETEGNIRRGNEGNVFGTLRSDGNVTNTKLYANGLQSKRGMDMDGKLLERRKWQKKANGLDNIGKNGDVANTSGIGFQREGGSTQLEGGRLSFNNPQNNKTTWDNFPTQSPICGGDDGLPTELDGITFSKWRNESIKAYGNAIVPQVAYEIFKAIEATIQGVD
jgi:DNA (cytosine-5)-methyltransferase 1